MRCCRLAVAVVALGAGALAQDSAPVELQRLLRRGQLAEATTALRREAADPATAAARLAASIEACAAEAALDLWLEIADEAGLRRPGDAPLAFYTGTVRADLQQLRLADAAFARAAAIDPAAVGPRLARAQLAVRRFDPVAALEACRGLDVPAAAEIRAEQERRLDQSAGKAQLLAAVLGALWLGLVAAGALRLVRESSD